LQSGSTDAQNSTGKTAAAYGGYINIPENGFTVATGGAGNTDNDWKGGRQTAAMSASKYFDLDVTTTTNTVVIVYYDEAESRLVLKYSSNAVDGSAPGTAVLWTPSAINFPQYVGEHVSMVLEGNAVHIAAFDAADGDLKYINVPNYTGTAYTAVTVDQFGSVGNWTQIKLKDEKPYISYYNATEAGSRESLKLAYAINKIDATHPPKSGVDAIGYTTGDWEYMTVPSKSPAQGGTPKFQKVNLGFTTDTAFGTVSAKTPVLGYLGSTIEFVYPYGE
jgi:hypothetical protein